jgi:phage-related protein
VPKTPVVIFCDRQGHPPLLDWLDHLPARVQVKCQARLERLGEMGFELRRPEADYLQSGIYELRVAFHTQNYRMLYFFHHNRCVVVSHGLIKEDRVPPKEIELALANKRLFESDPERHTYGMEEKR